MHACRCLSIVFVHVLKLVLCVCVALNNEDMHVMHERCNVHMSMFVPLRAYVCVSPVCELE